MHIRNHSDEELAAEIERRKQPQQTKPQPVDNPGWFGLIELLESIISDVDQKGYSKDCKQWIFEKALTVLYGNDIFNWWDERYTDD